LKAFINLDAETPSHVLSWKVGIHMTFVLSGVLFAVTDRLVEYKGHH